MHHQIMEIKNIEKFCKNPFFRKSKPIINGINLRLKEGIALGILGPDHSGKSLLLKILAGKIKPSSGEILLEKETDKRFTTNLGYMPEISQFPSVFTVTEILQYHLMFHSQNIDSENKERNQVIKEILDPTPLKELDKTKINKLSDTEKRWLSFLIATCHNPKIILLDEPFKFMDEEHIIILKEKIDHLLSLNKSIVIATSNLANATNFCCEINIINNGKIVHRAKNILKTTDEFFCLQVSGASREVLESTLEEKKLENWSAIFFEGFLAKIFYKSYPNCYNLLEALIEKGFVIVKFDTASNPQFDNLQTYYSIGNTQQ